MRSFSGDGYIRRLCAGDEGIARELFAMMTDVVHRRTELTRDTRSRLTSTSYRMSLNLMVYQLNRCGLCHTPESPKNWSMFDACHG